MSSTKKMIQISPALLKPAKTAKKRTTSSVVAPPKPIVPASQLKQRLLKRLKEVGISPKTNMDEEEAAEEDESNDEFKAAMHFLSDVRQKKRAEQPKMRTLKRPPLPAAIPAATNNIMLDLPPELFDIPVTQTLPKVTEGNFVLSVPKDNVPYGCLKGGKKRTYREWKQLEHVDAVRPPTPPKRHTTTPQHEPQQTRESKLEQIRQKLKKMQELTANEQANSESVGHASVGHTPEDIEYTYDDIGDILKVKTPPNHAQPRRVIKQTIKRTYTLGKRPKHRQVAVLIKNKDTRKKIINAHQELTKTNIQDVRRYLKQHGLLKIGSTCPPDILRKTFEVSMLAGEVTNTNAETAMHNLMSEE